MRNNNYCNKNMCVDERKNKKNNISCCVPKLRTKKPDHQDPQKAHKRFYFFLQLVNWKECNKTSEQCYYSNTEKINIKGRNTIFVM